MLYVSLQHLKQQVRNINNKNNNKTDKRKWYFGTFYVNVTNLQFYLKYSFLP